MRFEVVAFSHSDVDWWHMLGRLVDLEGPNGQRMRGRVVAVDGPTMTIRNATLWNGLWCRAVRAWRTARNRIRRRWS